MDKLMKIYKCYSYEEMSIKAKSLVAEDIHNDPEGLISFPGGDTPIGMIKEFVKDVNSGKLDISRLKYVSLDEWVGLSTDDIGSCGHFNKTHLLDKLDKSFKKTHIIDGSADDIEKERQKLDDFIAENGPLNVIVLGIGLNGHVGFNEEGVDFSLNAHITHLSPVTTKVMVKYFNFTPTKGITIGLSQIMSAKKVILIANGANKANILAKALKGPITNQVPASVLQSHKNLHVVTDNEAAKEL